MLIIGIDCATVASKTGLALAEYFSGVLTIKDCLIASTKLSVAKQILPWVKHAKLALLALDSPLGWPAAMGNAIAHHKAGAAIPISPNELFRRHTDEIVRKSIGKVPLEVGADRIARTALSALSLIRELGVISSCNIPLAWTRTLSCSIYAIEVYPAGTLRSYERMGYASGSGDTLTRKKKLLKKMIRDGKISMEAGPLKAIDNEHAIDSVFCEIAAVDFLEGQVIHPKPEEKALARKEGWIWVRSGNRKD